MHKYEQIYQIGRGSFGTVYKCRLKQTAQYVALKAIPLRGKSAGDIEALHKEIQMLSTMRHPNIISFYESFEEDNTLFIVTELAETDLFEVLQDGPLPLVEIQKIALQTLQVLKFLHQSRIAHRDVKPQNVLLCANSVCKLADFGFARQLSNVTLNMASVKGSPLYLAPEIARGSLYGFETDVWSFGVMLFELATGKPPFQASDYIQLIRLLQRDQLHVPYQNFSIFAKNPQFAALLQLCLTVAPEERSTAAELLQHPFVTGAKLAKPEHSRARDWYSLRAPVQTTHLNVERVEKIEEATSLSVWAQVALTDGLRPFKEVQINGRISTNGFKKFNEQIRQFFDTTAGNVRPVADKVAEIVGDDCVNLELCLCLRLLCGYAGCDYQIVAGRYPNDDAIKADSTAIKQLNEFAKHVDGKFVVTALQKIISTNTDEIEHQVHAISLCLILMTQMSISTKIDGKQSQSELIEDQKLVIDKVSLCQQYLVSQVSTLANILLQYIKRLLRVENNFDLTAVIQESFSLLIVEYINTFYQRRRENPVNIPQAVYDQQQKIMKDIFTTSDSNEIHIIKICFLRFIINIINVELFPAEKTTNLFSQVFSGANELLSANKILQRRSPDEFQEEIKQTQYYKTLQIFYFSFASVLPFMRFSPTTHGSELSNLSYKILTNLMDLKPQQPHVQHKCQFVISHETQQDSLKLFLAELERKQALRGEFILPHADLVLSVEHREFQYSEMDFRINPFQQTGINAFCSQHILGSMISLSKFLMCSILVDQSDLNKIINQFTTFVVEKQAVQQKNVELSEARINILQIVLMMSKNNVQLAQLIGKAQIYIENTKISYLSLLILQIFYYKAHPKECDLWLQLMAVLLQNAENPIKNVELDSISISSIVINTNKHVLDPTFLITMLNIFIKQVIKRGVKATYKFNSNWQLNEAIQTTTGTVITSPTEKYSYYPQLLEVLLALHQHNLAELSIFDFVQNLLDSILTDTICSQTSKRGLLDSTLQALVKSDPSVTIFNRLTSILLLQHENSLKRQKQATFVARHKEIMQLECATEGCMECLRGMNGFEEQVEQNLKQKQHWLQLASVYGMVSYIQIAQRLVDEDRLAAVILQEMLAVILQFIDESNIAHQMLLFGQDVCEQLIALTVALLYKTGQQTINLSLFVAVCAEYQVIKTLLGLIKYCKCSQTQCLIMSLLSFLLNVECPLARIFVHQCVQFGILSAGFFSYIQYIDMTKKYQTTISCLQILAEVSAISEAYQNAIQDYMTEKFLYELSEIQSNIVKISLFNLCSSILTFNGRCLRKLQYIFGLAVQSFLTNKDDELMPSILQFMKNLLIHSDAYAMPIRELLPVFTEMIENRTNYLDLVLQIIIYLRVHDSDIEIEKILVSLCAQDGINVVIGAKLAVSLGFAGASLELVEKKLIK